MQAAMVTADIFVTHVAFQVLRILLSMGPVFSHTLHSITPGCLSKRPWRLKLEALPGGCGTPAEWRSDYRVGPVYPNVRGPSPRPAISLISGDRSTGQMSSNQSQESG